MSAQRLVRFLVYTTMVGTLGSADVWTQAAPPVPPTATGGAPTTGQPPVVPATGQRGRGFVPVQIGPPAPVPPEVAIPRPSPEELTQVNDAMRTFIAADKSAAGPVLRKYESLLLLQPPRLNVAATFTQTVQRMGPQARGIRRDSKGRQHRFALSRRFDHRLVGPGRREHGDVREGTSARYKTANFAVSGDTTQGVLWGLRNGEGQGFQPKAIMLMIGTNNSFTSTAPEIAEGIGAIVLEMRHDFPDAKILLLAIFPRSVPGDPVRDKIADVNKIIAGLDDQRHVFYMDIGAKFLDEKGVFLANTFRPDNLHPVAKGYDIWGEAVQSKLAELMK